MLKITQQTGKVHRRALCLVVYKHRLNHRTPDLDLVNNNNNQQPPLASVCSLSILQRNCQFITFLFFLLKRKDKMYSRVKYDLKISNITVCCIEMPLLTINWANCLQLDSDQF